MTNRRQTSFAPGILACLAVALLVAGLILPVASATDRGDRAAVWQRAFNAWEAGHGAPDRIVAYVDRGGVGGLEVLDVVMSWRTPSGPVQICGWFAIRQAPKHNPGHQIAADGRMSCAGLRRAGCAVARVSMLHRSVPETVAPPAGRRGSGQAGRACQGENRGPAA